MKKIIGNWLILLFGAVIAACSPEEFGLDAPDVTPGELVEGIAFKIEHDQENPNIVYLTSLMDKKYTPLWEHPQGRSQDERVTLKIPFEGSYEVKFGVQTRGGAVYGDPATFTIDQFYAGFVDNELWTLLTGGIGQEKTWIHDNGQYGLATGEVDYADPSTTVEWGNFTPNWSPGKGHTGDDLIWQSSMTFSLAGGANVAVHNVATAGNKDESGTFMLDVDAYTLTFTDANIMHTQGWDYKTTNWAKGLRILTLNENQLRVAVYREEVSGEGVWWMIWNFVSKEYADNYVPGDVEDPVPEIDGDAQDILTTTKTKTWTLSLATPYDWSDLNGTLLNNFADAAAYVATGWAAYDADMIAATKLSFTATSGTGGNFVFSSYNNEDVEGAYTIDQNNDIDFGQPLNAVISQTDFGWVSTTNLTTSGENKLRILKTKTDALGANVTDMWLGQRSSEKEEYMVFHFVLGAGSAPGADAAKELKKQLTNNNSQTFKIDVGYPFTWGYKVGGGNHSFLADAVPDWTGWTGSETNINQVKNVRFAFGMDNKVTYVDNLGVSTNGTFEIIPADEGYGVNIIKFMGINPNFEMTGTTGGWVWFNPNVNDPASPVPNMPTDAGFFELYEWETDNTGAVSGLWFGKLKTISDFAPASERTIFHYVVDK